jgi:ABC-type phosphate transport system permease subunit
MKLVNTSGVFLVATAIAMVLATETALACPVCFRVEAGATTNGVQAAVWVLVGITAVVLGAFGRFIAGFVRRERDQCRR